MRGHLPIFRVTFFRTNISSNGGEFIGDFSNRFAITKLMGTYDVMLELLAGRLSKLAISLVFSEKFQF